MNRKQARNYLKSSGMSEEQIAEIESAFTCEDAYKQGWHDAIHMALKEVYTIHHYGDIFNVVQEETLIGLGMAYEQVSTKKTGRWITKIKSDLRGDMWPTNPKCSECGGEPYYSNTIYNYKFCPYCGAKMGVEE